MQAKKIKEFDMSKTYKVNYMPGDGTGPEVLAEGKKVVEAAAKLEGFSFDWQPSDLGGDRYLKTGEILPDSALKELPERLGLLTVLSKLNHVDCKI